MFPLPPALQRVLNDAMVSLSAWHVLAGLALTPGRRRGLASLLMETDLDVAQATEAITALVERGYVETDAEGAFSLAPAHAGPVTELCERIEADRGLQRTVIRDISRREWASARSAEIRVVWAPAATEPSAS